MPYGQNLNWNDLRYVLAVARAGSLSKAARTLRVNETTVSRRLAAIEEALGAHVFDRIPGGKLPLSKAGEVVVRHAEQVERHILNLCEEVAGDDVEVAGVVRVTTVPILANRILGPLSHRLLGRYPNLRLEIIADFRDISLMKREADIALRFSAPGKDAGNAILARKIGEVRFDVYASSQISDEEAAKLPWISYVSTMDHLPQAQWMRDDKLRRAESEAGLSFNDAEGLLQTVTAGHGKSLLPCIVGDGDVRLRRVASCSSEHERSRELWVLSHPDQRGLARVSAVIDWLERIFREPGIAPDGSED